MAEICYIEWHATPFRTDDFLEIWRPAAERAPAFGAKSWSLTRDIDDPQHIRQAMVWDSREDFERFWYSDEVSAAREAAINYYDVPVLPNWHSVVEAE